MGSMPGARSACNKHQVLEGSRRSDLSLVKFWNLQGSQCGIQKGTSFPGESFPVSVLTHPPLCCHGLSMESPCCSINCDSLGDSHLLLLFIFTRSQAAPVNSDSQMCVIYKSLRCSLKGKCPHPRRRICANKTATTHRSSLQRSIVDRAETSPGGGVQLMQ